MKLACNCQNIIINKNSAFTNMNTVLFKTHNLKKKKINDLPKPPTPQREVMEMHVPPVWHWPKSKSGLYILHS